ncbi:MAG TPA: hypothetical protein VHK65_05300 [Candidatus Dormibacteraeota bacterium]|nr:hypothetical protein [Candidatus Dormibacteraeota bacterium]
MILLFVGEHFGDIRGTGAFVMAIFEHHTVIVTDGGELADRRNTSIDEPYNGSDVRHKVHTGIVGTLVMLPAKEEACFGSGIRSRGSQEANRRPAGRAELPNLTN